MPRHRKECGPNHGALRRERSSRRSVVPRAPAFGPGFGRDAGRALAPTARRPRRRLARSLLATPWFAAGAGIVIAAVLAVDSPAPPPYRPTFPRSPRPARRCASGPGRLGWAGGRGAGQGMVPAHGPRGTPPGWAAGGVSGRCGWGPVAAGPRGLRSAGDLARLDARGAHVQPPRRPVDLGAHTLNVRVPAARRAAVRARHAVAAARPLAADGAAGSHRTLHCAIASWGIVPLLPGTA